MKDIYVHSMPDCDVCKRAKGVYDARMLGRTAWANMCESCMTVYGDWSMGNKRVIQPVVEKKNIGQFANAFVIDSLEQICESAVQEVKCPFCDTHKRVEGDADYIYDCPCGAKIKVNPNF